jgi:hypothetical protein
VGPWSPILLLVGCAPTVVHVEPPSWAPAAASGPSVELDYPIDARPAGERRDGGYYDTTVPLPVVTYGDTNLRPLPVESVDEALRAGLASRGVPLVDRDGDLRVRVFVLHCAGTRDISDAQWVSTLTGGLAGTVGKFLYPVFLGVDATIRLEVLDRAGAVLATRDVIASEIVRTSVANTWSWLHLFRRNVVAESFTRAFTTVHHRLGYDGAIAIDEARHGEALTTGVPVATPAEHALLRVWSGIDTFDLRNTDAEDPAALAKYGSARFSLWTGHDQHHGEVVGHLALPIDNLGYEVAISDRTQLVTDLTVLGLYNGAELGVRTHVLAVGATRVSVEGGFGFDVALPPEDRFRPSLAALDGGAGALVSTRPRELTSFLAFHASAVHVFRTYDAFPDLEPGALVSLSAGPGFELQITPTMVVGVRLDATARFQNGDLLDLGPLGQITPVPRIGVGLR